MYHHYNFVLGVRGLGSYYTQTVVGVFRWGSTSLTLNMKEKP